MGYLRGFDGSQQLSPFAAEYQETAEKSPKDPKAETRINMPAGQDRWTPYS
jgi:hypothetical protein